MRRSNTTTSVASHQSHIMHTHHSRPSMKHRHAPVLHAEVGCAPGSGVRCDCLLHDALHYRRYSRGVAGCAIWLQACDGAVCSIKTCLTEVCP